MEGKNTSQEKKRLPKTQVDTRHRRPSENDAGRCRTACTEPEGLQGGSEDNVLQRTRYIEEGSCNENAQQLHSKINNTWHKKKEISGVFQGKLLATRNLEQELQKNQTHINSAFIDQRRVEANLLAATAASETRVREEKRRLADKDISLANNKRSQTHLATLVPTSKQSNRNFKARYTMQVIHANKSPRVRVEDEEEAVKSFKIHSLELERRTYEDLVKHLQAEVYKEVEKEHILSHRVKSSEFSRQKQGQVVRHLQQNLALIRKRNDQEIKQQIIDKRNEEEKLQHLLLRERARLGKAHADREESYRLLQQIKKKLQEDSDQLYQLKTEHQRKLEIGEKTDSNGRF